MYGTVHVWYSTCMVQYIYGTVHVWYISTFLCTSQICLKNFLSNERKICTNIQYSPIKPTNACRCFISPLSPKWNEKILRSNDQHIILKAYLKYQRYATNAVAKYQKKQKRVGNWYLLYLENHTIHACFCINYTHVHVYIYILYIYTYFLTKFRFKSGKYNLKVV